MRDETVQFPLGGNPPTARLLYGQDAAASLALLPDASIDCICTSPPYFGLRDYGGKAEQIGLEDTPEQYVNRLVAVFDAAKRVLKPNGTLWLNLGDTYANDGKWGGTTGGKHAKGLHGHPVGRGKKTTGLKGKDLIGIPWEVAFALRRAGWYLRSDILWQKANAMPEPVKDRPTKAHEYVFLLAHPDSDGSYYYDQDSIREPHTKKNWFKGAVTWQEGRAKHHNMPGSRYVKGEELSTPFINEPHPKGRNRRSVWTTSLKAYKGAHFAVWPEALVEPMVLAGCPAGGTVLDPFSGSATTGLVALKNGRNYIGIDLNEDYLELAKARLLGTEPPDKSGEPSSTPFEEDW